MALPDGRDSAALEREASVGTPLEWNCTEAGSFDTNVRGSPREAVEASKQAVAIRRCLTFLFMSCLSRLCRTQQSAAPESLGASKEPEEVQGPSALGSWLPDGSASLSKFSSTAEMLASQAAGLFSKSEEAQGSAGACKSRGCWNAGCTRCTPRSQFAKGPFSQQLCVLERRILILSLA